MRAAAGNQISRNDSYTSGVYLRSSSNPLARGSVFANRYHIISCISQTALSKVFAVHDLQQNKRIILKTARLDSYGNFDPEFIQKVFKTEAEVLRMGLHPMFPILYESGQHENIPYIAMEYIQGESLLRLIRSPEKITLRRALRIVTQILAGLKTLHDRGWVYRDLKPENILICGDKVRLIDFNLACRIELQEEGKIDGTPNYLSPEQASAKAARKNSDIYALGIIFYEMLTGNNPMSHPSMYTAVQNQLNKDLPPLPQESIEMRLALKKTKDDYKVERILHYLGHALAKMTNKNPEHRIQSVKESSALLWPIRIITLTA